MRFTLPVLCFLLIGSVARAEFPVQNPGFEDGPSHPGWQFEYPAVSIYDSEGGDPSLVHSGRYSLQITTAGGGGNAKQTVDLPVAAGTDISLRAYLKRLGGCEGCKTFTMTTFGFDSGGHYVWGRNAFFCGPYSDWTEAVLSFTVPSDAAYLQVMFDTQNGSSPCGATCYVDDVNVEGTPSVPAFEIVSAAFDSTIYSSGQDANLTVSVHSNWATGAFEVAPTAEPHFGSAIPLGSQDATLSPGMTSVTSFIWPVPTITGRTEVNAGVQVEGQGLSGATTFFDVTAVTEIAEQRLLELEGETLDCLTDAASNCWDVPWSFVIGLVPFVGTEQATEAVIDHLCLAHSYEESGHGRQGNAMSTVAAIDAYSAMVGAARDYCCATGGCIVCASPHSLLELAPDVFSATLVCLTALEDWLTPPRHGMRPGDGGASRTPGFVSELADSLTLALGEAGTSLADLILVQGRCRIRVDADSASTTVDSIAHVGVVVFDVGGGEARCAAIYPNASRFWGPPNNPDNASTVLLLADSSDTFRIVGVHAQQGGEVIKLEYPPFQADSGAVATMSLALDSTTFPLEVDYDGDGQIDEILYPEGMSGADELLSGSPRVGVRGLTNNPNPFRPPTTITLEAGGVIENGRIEICDVTGRLVRRIGLGQLPPGRREIAWDGKSDAGIDLSSGIYYYRVLHAGGATGPKRAVLLR